MGRLHRLLAVLLAFAKTEPETPSDNKCSWRSGTVVLGHERDVLTVAMLHPQDGRVIDRLRQETGLRVFPVLTHPYELQVALEHIM